MLPESSVQSLKGSFKGKIILPGDDAYDAARKVYNGMIDRHPAIIAQCTNESDVIEALRFGKEQGLLIAVRGGGHNGGGLGICDGGLVIDLSGIRHVKVDPEKKIVIVGGGCTWADVDKATHEHGLATPSGIISSTGVGGLTLGGGLGYLTRKYGLTIDNLLAADVVLANGELVHVSADEHPDLFWALRGGGGNFGIVTSFTFQCHDVSLIYGGPMLWEQDRAAEILKWYRQFINEAPDELNGFFAFLVVPPGPPFPEHLHLKKMCGIVWAYAGPLDKAESVFEPIRKQFPPALDLTGPLPHPVLQSLFDPLLPSGLQWYWRADYFNEIPDEAIEQHLKFGAALPTMLSTMHIYPVNGKAGRVGRNETAWSYRESNWAQVIVGIDPDPANAGIISQWCKDYWAALHPWSAGGAYVNFMMDEGSERVQATYRDNYERLAAIKGKYDPKNIFRVNQNIKPVMESVPAEKG